MNPLVGPHMRSLVTPLCQLEPQVASHAEELFPVLSDEAIYEFEGEPPPSLDCLRDGLQRKEGRVSPDGTERWFNWVVRLPDGEVAGYVQATVMPSGWSYVGYELSSKHWRKGIGRSAVAAMLEELANGYHVHTHVAVLKAANFRSLGLLQKLGFSPCPVSRLAEFAAEQDELVLMLQVPGSSGGGAEGVALHRT